MANPPKPIEPEVKKKVPKEPSRHVPPDIPAELLKDLTPAKPPAGGEAEVVKTTRLMKVNSSAAKEACIEKLSKMSPCRSLEGGFDRWWEQTQFAEFITGEYGLEHVSSFRDLMREVYSGPSGIRILVADDLEKVLKNSKILATAFSGAQKTVFGLKNIGHLFRAFVKSPDCSIDERGYYSWLAWNNLTDLKSEGVFAGGERSERGECDKLLMEVGKTFLQATCEELLDKMYPVNRAFNDGKRESVYGRLAAAISNSTDFGRVSRLVERLKELTPYGMLATDEDSFKFFKRDLDVEMPLFTSNVRCVLYSHPSKEGEEVAKLRKVDSEAFAAQVGRQGEGSRLPYPDAIFYKTCMVHDVDAEVQFQKTLDGCVKAGDLNAVRGMLQDVEERHKRGYYRETRGGKDFLDEFELRLNGIEGALDRLWEAGVRAAPEDYRSLLHLKRGCLRNRLLRMKDCRTPEELFRKECSQITGVRKEVVDAAVSGVDALCSQAAGFDRDDMLYGFSITSNMFRKSLLERVQRVMPLSNGSLVPEVVRKLYTFDYRTDLVYGIVRSESGSFNKFWGWASIDRPEIAWLRDRTEKALEGLEDMHKRLAFVALATSPGIEYAKTFLECLEDPSKFGFREKISVVVAYASPLRREAACCMIDSLTWGESNQLYSSLMRVSPIKLAFLDKISRDLDPLKRLPSEMELMLYQDVAQASILKQDDEAVGNALRPYFAISKYYDRLRRSFLRLEPGSDTFVGNVLLLYTDAFSFSEMVHELEKMPLEDAGKAKHFTEDEIRKYREAMEKMVSGESPQAARVLKHRKRIDWMIKSCDSLFTDFSSQILILAHPGREKPDECLKLAAGFFNGYREEPYNPSWEVA